MAVIYQKEQKKFSFFLKKSMILLFLGIVLHVFGLTFLGEMSYFACCTVILVGVEYIILTRPRQHRHLKRKDSIRFLVLLVFSNFYIYTGCRKGTRSRQPQPRKDLFKSS